MSANTQARWILLAAATALALYASWIVVRPFLDVLAWSVTLAIVFAPLNRRLRRRLRRPGLAALASLLIVAVAVLVPLLALAGLLAAQVADAAFRAQEAARTVLENGALAEHLRQVHAWASRFVDVDRLLSGVRFGELASRASQVLLSGTTSLLGGAAGALVGLVFMLFTLFFLFRDGTAMVASLPDALPLDRELVERMVRRTGEILHASLSGVVVIACLQGALGGVMFAILGLPSPLVWGAVMALLSMIPMLGAGIVWLPAAVYLAATGHWGKAIVLGAWGALVISLIDNLLRPKLVGQRTKMHELVVFFAVLGGLRAFGMVGLLLGPVVVAVTAALLDALRLSVRGPDIAEPTAAPDPAAGKDAAS